MLPYQFFPKIPPCTVFGIIICCEFFKSDEDNGTKPSPLSFLSPQIDLTGANQMQFEFWWHMFGNTMGTMHIDLSNDFGSSWNNDIIPAWTDNQDLWQKTTVSLGAYTNDTVIIRIRFVSGTSFSSDAAIDDIKIYDLLPVDVGVSYIDSPAVQTCNY